jgi:hypothetical protein
MGEGGQRHVPATLSPGKAPVLISTGGCLEGRRKSRPTGVLTSNPSTSRQSQYQLRYPGRHDVPNAYFI